jgi:hypothetical protein
MFEDAIASPGRRPAPEQRRVLPYLVRHSLAAPTETSLGVAVILSVPWSSIGRNGGLRVRILRWGTIRSLPVSVPGHA